MTSVGRERTGQPRGVAGAHESTVVRRDVEDLRAVVGDVPVATRWMWSFEGGDYGQPGLSDRDHRRFRAPAMRWHEDGRAVQGHRRRPAGRRLDSGRLGSLCYADEPAHLTGNRTTNETLLRNGRTARQRTVVEGAGDALHATTSDEGGRGTPET